MLFFQIFVFTFSLFISVTISKPEGRYAAASTLVGYKLYFIGGQFQNGSISSELFYLDLSTSFDVNGTAKWSNPSSAPVTSSWATATIGGDNNSTIILIGGIMNPSNDTTVYDFDTNKGNWSNLNTLGVLNQRCQGSSLSYDPVSGNNYIFGGQSVTDSSQWFNVMIIFDSIHFSWSNITTITAPSKRSGHTSTLLKTGIIVVIGGWEITGTSNIPRLANMSQIWTFNTSSDKWSPIRAEFINNAAVDSRIYHSAILAPDGSIIIYGGSNGTENTKVSPDLAVLNVSSTPFQWSVPNINSSSNSARSLVAHTAVAIGNYMILLFGNVTGSNSSVNDMIYLFNTSSYNWVSSYQSNAPNQSNGFNILIIVGIIIGAIILLFIIGACAIGIYKRHRMKHTLLTTNSQQDTTRQVFQHFHDDDPINSAKSEEYHQEYFDNLPLRNFSETPTSTARFNNDQQQIKKPQHFMSIKTVNDQRNESNVPIVNYVQHDVQPQYAEYGTTHGSYPNPNPD